MMFHEHHQTQPQSGYNRSEESFSYSYHSSPFGPSQPASSLDTVGIFNLSTESSITPLPRAYAQSYHPQQNFSEDTAFFSSQEALLGRLEGSSRGSAVKFQIPEKTDGDEIQAPSASYYANKNRYSLDIERNAHCEPSMEYENLNRKTRIIWSSQRELKLYVILLPLPSPLPPSPPPPPLLLPPALFSAPARFPHQRRNNNYYWEWRDDLGTSKAFV